MTLSFGPFAFDPQSRLLWREGTEIALPPRVLGVLELLIERAGQVVARQDLLDRVWKDAFVTDTSLAEAVSFLRQALGDDPQSPTYIQTVHRRGYRFLLTPTTVPGPIPRAGHVAEAETVGGELPDRNAAGLVRAAEADWTLVPWIAATLCAALAIAAVWHIVTAPTPDAPPVARFEVKTNAGTTFDDDSQPIAIAPDGRSLAWSACGLATGRCAIYVRAIDRLDAQPLAGTDDGHAPVFSPDGRWIAFFADGALKKIAVAGGAPTTLASATDPDGAAWGTNGRIAFAGSAAGGLSLVDEQGGPVQPLTQTRRGELRHRRPAWITSGTGRNGLVFIAATSPGEATGTLDALAPDASGPLPLRRGIHRAVPAGGGYLLLAAGPDLQAATFDDRALLLTGANDSVPAPASGERPQFAAGAEALAVVRAAGPSQRVWTDGVEAASLARLGSMTISPDSRRAAGVDGNGDIWVVDLAANAATRLTFAGGNASPTWSADGARLVFATRDGTGLFHAVSGAASDRIGTTTPLASAPPQAFPTSAAADGRVVLTEFSDGHTRVIVMSSDGRAPRVLTDGPFDERAAVFSPDGRWLALESTASGRNEIVVRSASDGARVSVSTDGGSHARWSEDGRSIYFESGRRLLRVAFTADAPPHVGRAEIVLDRAGERVLAVAPSGRILIERRPPCDAAVLVLHWLRELRERLPLPVTTPR